jgi:Fe-S-cluster containining protein
MKKSIWDYIDCETCEYNCCTSNRKFKDKRLFGFTTYDEDADRMIEVHFDCNLGHCIHLDSETKKCKIYENRYYECKAYPFYIDSDGDLCISTTCAHYGRVLEAYMNNPEEIKPLLKDEYERQSSFPEKFKQYKINLSNDYKIKVKLKL